ncbi:hypothetical protein GCM10029992_05590 [Glycomyces albus]
MSAYARNARRPEAATYLSRIDRFSSRLNRFSSGTSSARWSENGECTESVTVTSGCSVTRRSRFGANPTVETVIRRGDMPPIAGSVSISTAPNRCGLARASPMPMNATLRTGGASGPCQRSSQTCPRISSAVRLRSRPIAPVAQKVQPKPQPAWDETHSEAQPSR